LVSFKFSENERKGKTVKVAKAIVMVGRTIQVENKLGLQKGVTNVAKRVSEGLDVLVAVGDGGVA
jgi:hypothetical protein